MWALAVGLHNALEWIQINDSSGCGHLPGELVPLEKFDYLNERMGCVLRKSLYGISFTGVTVSHTTMMWVQYVSNKDRPYHHGIGTDCFQ